VRSVKFKPIKPERKFTRRMVGRGRITITFSPTAVLWLMRDGNYEINFDLNEFYVAIKDFIRKRLGKPRGEDWLPNVEYVFHKDSGDLIKVSFREEDLKKLKDCLEIDEGKMNRAKSELLIAKC